MENHDHLCHLGIKFQLHCTIKLFSEWDFCQGRKGDLMIYDRNNGINKMSSNSSWHNFHLFSLNVLRKVMKPLLPPLIGKIAKQQEPFVIAKMTHFKHPITAQVREHSLVMVTCYHVTKYNLSYVTWKRDRHR